MLSTLESQLHGGDTRMAVTEGPHTVHRTDAGKLYILAGQLAVSITFPFHSGALWLCDSMAQPVKVASSMLAHGSWGER